MKKKLFLNLNMNKNDELKNESNPLVAPNEKIESLNLQVNSFPTEKLIDKIIENGYFTKYPIFMTISIFVGFIANGLVTNLFYLIIIPIKKHFAASDFMLEAIAGVLFIGLSTGSAYASLLSKKYGRAQTIKYLYGIMLITYLISTLWFSLFILLLSRIILGFCVGAIEPLIFNSFGEYLPSKIRGFLLMNSYFFCTLAVFLQNIIALKVMPLLESENLEKFLFILNIFYVIAFIVNYFMLNNSPRNLIINSFDIIDEEIKHQKVKEALKILNNMNRKNLSKDEEEKLINEIYNSTSNKKLNEDFKELFKPKFFKTTIIGIFVFFVSACEYFGFYLISTLTLETLNKNENEKMENNVKNTNRDIILNQIYIAFFDLIGSIAGGALAEVKYIGRKGVIWIFMILSAVTIIPSCYSVSLFNVFFTMSITLGTVYGDMLITYFAEIFPTKLRDTSASFFLTSHRISGFISQFLFLGLFKLNYKLPYFFGSILNIIGTFTIFILPQETIGRPLDFEEVIY